MLPGDELTRQSLHNLRRGQKPVKVLQHENRRAVLRRQGGQRPDGGERVLSPGELGFRLTGNRQPTFNVPDRQPPVLQATQLGDLS